MKRIAMFGLLALILAGTVRATDLPLGHQDFMPGASQPVGWRGDGSGRFPAATPVTDWDLTTKKNVIWQVKMPFFSCSSPIVVGDRVFTTAEPDLLICVDARTGKELWRRHNAIHMEKIEAKERERLYGVCEYVLEATSPWLRSHPGGEPCDPARALWAPYDDSRCPDMAAADADVQQKAKALGLDLAKIRAFYQEVGSIDQRTPPTKLDRAQALLCRRTHTWHGNTAPTPASDGKVVVTRVHSMAGWGYLVCYDLEGNRKWVVETGMTGGWGCPFDSPLIFDGKLISQTNALVNGKRKGALAAFDLASGKQIWVTPANTTNASPLRIDVDGVPVINHTGAFFSPADGSLLLDVNGGDLVRFESDSATFQGNYVLFGQSTQSANPIVFKLSWKTKGKELAYEIVHDERDVGKHDPRGMRFWPRGTLLLSDDFIYKIGFAGMHVIDMKQKKHIDLKVAKDQVIPHANSTPNEEDSCGMLGGRFVFGCGSGWPSQFAVVTAGGDPKLVAYPALDGAMVGNPYFQGNRIYMRDYNYLYCFGDPSQPYHSPKGDK